MSTIFYIMLIIINGEYMPMLRRVDDFLLNAKKADISISYYDAPDKAVDVRQ